MIGPLRHNDAGHQTSRVPVPSETSIRVPDAEPDSDEHAGPDHTDR